MFHICYVWPMINKRQIRSILLFLFVLEIDLEQIYLLFNHYEVYQ